MSTPPMGSTVKRMFVEGEWDEALETGREASHRMMRELDDHAAKHGMAVSGDVTILVSEPSAFAVPRTLRLEADVVTR